MARSWRVTVSPDNQAQSGSASRGLSTAAPPGTPAYTTPATTTTTVAGLQAAIDAAAAGDVIEVSAEPSTANITLTGGPAFTTASTSSVTNPNANTKVLIRPPLSIDEGTWYGDFRLTGTNLVVAGFGAGAKKIGTSGQDNSSGGAPGSGCWFWRCGASDLFFAIYDCDDAGLHNCWATSTAAAEVDRVQVSANSTLTVRPRIVDCWFAGRDRPAGSSSHVDTIQFFYLGSGEVWHPSVEGSVVHGSQNAGIQGSGFRGRFRLSNTAVSKLANHAVNVDTNVTPNGYYDLVENSTVDGNLLHEYRPNASDTAFFDLTNASNSSTKISGVYTYGGVAVPKGSQTVTETGVDYSGDATEFPVFTRPW